MRSWDGFGKNSAESDLFTYARLGDIAGLRRLVDSRTVNSSDERGQTPLIVAAYHGNAEAAEFLLEQGANPDHQNLTGDTALMGAAFKGHLAIVMMLLRFHADSGLVNSRGLNALGLATLFQRFSVIDFLGGASGEETARVKDPHGHH